MPDLPTLHADADADVDLGVDGDVAVAEDPVLTFYDDATGERTELTAAALGDWAARVAGLLRSGCRLGPGNRAAVLLPPHWQTAAVVLGAWSAGVEMSYRPWATAGLPHLGPDADLPLDAVFVERRRQESWLETVPDATHRFVVDYAPRENLAPPPGYRDFRTEIDLYPAGAPAPTAVRAVDPASPDGTSYRQWGDLAYGIAESLGLRAGDRILVDAAACEQPVTWLLAPLAVGATVVLCANLDRALLDARIAAERVTRVL